MFARSTITATGAVVAIATLGLAPATAAVPAIPLSGGQETSAADVDGHGFFTYSIDGTTFCWTLSCARWALSALSSSLSMESIASAARAR